MTVESTGHNPPAQEPQNVLTAELLDGVIHQPGINGLEALGVFEHHVSGIFALPDAPVVAAQVQAAVESNPGIDPAGQGVQKAGPTAPGQAVEDALGSWQVFDAGETVVALFVLDAGPVHLSGQPFASVEAHLDGERQPGLQPYVHQAELAVDEIEIQVQALAHGGDQSQLPGFSVPTNRVGLAGLDAGQDADQPLFDAVLLHDLASEVLFGEAGGRQITKGAPLLAGQSLGVLLEPTGEPFGERAEVLVQDVLARQEDVHSVTIADGPQGSPKEHAVETRQYACDAALMPLQKTLHDDPPADVFCQNNHARNRLGRHFSPFGCGRAAKPRGCSKPSALSAVRNPGYASA